LCYWLCYCWWWWKGGNGDVSDVGDTNDDDNDDINNNSDEDGESLWRWEFDCHKLVLCTIELSPSIIIIICKTTLVWFRTTQVWGGWMKFHKSNGNDVWRCLGWKQQHCKACVMI